MKLVKITFSGVSKTAPRTNDSIQRRVVAFDASAGSLRYTLQKSADVGVRIFDMRGRLVFSRLEQSKEAGTHRMSVPLERLSRGLYTAEFECVGFERNTVTVCYPDFGKGQQLACPSSGIPKGHDAR